MPDTTPTYGLPYPEASDAPSGHTQIQAAVEAVETELARVDGAADGIDSRVDTLERYQGNGVYGEPNVSTTNPAFTSNAGYPGFTFSAPPSGKLAVFVGGQGEQIAIGYEIRQNDQYGPLLVPANYAKSWRNTTTSYSLASVGVFEPGLPTSGLLFIRPLFATNSGAEGTAQLVHLIALPIG